MAIVTTFPFLGSVIEPEDTISQPYHLFFNPQFGGFLETLLKAVRNLILKPKNMKRQHGLGKREGQNEINLKEHVNLQVKLMITLSLKKCYQW